MLARWWRLYVLSFFLSFLVWPLLPAHCRCRGLLLHQITLTHTHTHAVGFLWTRDRPVGETSTWQHTTLTTDRHSCPRRDSNPQYQQSTRPQNYALDRSATQIFKFTPYFFTFPNFQEFGLRVRWRPNFVLTSLVHPLSTQNNAERTVQPVKLDNSTYYHITIIS